MARIRTIKPEFWEDEKVALLSRDARLMLIGCFNLADDEGLLRWTPAYIKSCLFMYDDDLGVDEVKSLMDEVTGQELVLTYTPAVKGSAKQQLGWIIKFRIHQKINRPQPSKLPAPPLQHRATQAAYANRDGYICHLCGGPVNETPYRPPLDPYSPEPSAPGGECLNISLDHIKPRIKGGGDHPTNVALAHLGCNKGRRERPISEFSVPLSVRSALISLGWVSDDGVNGSRTNSVNDSPPDMEREREEEWEQGSEEPPYPPDDEPPASAPHPKRNGGEIVRARISSLPARSVDAYRIAEAFSDSLPTPIESGLLSGIGVQIDKCLKRGIPPPAVAAGLRAWTDSDSWSPTQIPNFVHKANNGGRNGKPTEKAIGYDTALAELLTEVTTL